MRALDEDDGELFDGPPSTPFEHKVITAYHASLETVTERLERAGLAGTASLREPGRSQDATGDRRPHLAIAASALTARPGRRADLGPE
jgi:hypothetical protein